MRQIEFRGRKASDKTIIGFERVNESGHWEHQRVNREGWLLGCITSEDALIREQLMCEDDGNRYFEDDFVLSHDFEVLRIWIDEDGYLMGGKEKEWDMHFNASRLKSVIGSVHDTPAQK